MCKQPNGQNSVCFFPVCKSPMCFSPSSPGLVTVLDLLAVDPELAGEVDVGQLALDEENRKANTYSPVLMF